MKNITTYIWLVAVIFASSCVENILPKTNSSNTLKDIVEKPNSRNHDNSLLSQEISSIIENVKRINAIDTWAKIDTQELQTTSEGGLIEYYYDNKLEKIVYHNYGETFQHTTEYYLLNEKLSYVLDKTHQYNRPIYYDETMMKENNDTTYFDINKSKTIETQTYFRHDTVLHHIIKNDDNIHPVEEKNFLSSYTELISNIKINKL